VFRRGFAPAASSQICADFAAEKGIRGAHKLVRVSDVLVKDTICQWLGRFCCSLNAVETAWNNPQFSYVFGAKQIY
jgi:hypothetical protein